MRNRQDIADLIMSMDSRKDIEDVREQIVGYGKRALSTMYECFPKLRRWRGRQAVIYTAIKFARVSPVARQLGFLGLEDRSKPVRQHACALAAFSLDATFLPALEHLQATDDAATAAEARAAIDAIEGQNHHLFMDRWHSGRVKWHVMGAEDVPDH